MEEELHTTVIRLGCINAPSCSVFFEPEGAEHILREGDVFTVEISGALPGHVEISFVPDGIIVGAWNRATTRVHNLKGEELTT